MSVKVICKLADCVNWDNGLCGAEEIRIDREGYCATYEEIPEEAVDEIEISGHGVEDLGWEDEEEEDLEIEELGQEDWEDLDEDEEEEEEEGEVEEGDRWAR